MPISNNYCLPKYPPRADTPLIASRATTSRGYHNGTFFGAYQSYGTVDGTPICAPPPVDLSYCGAMRSGIGAYQDQVRTQPFNPLVAVRIPTGNQKYKRGFLIFK